MKGRMKLLTGLFICMAMCIGIGISTLSVSAETNGETAESWIVDGKASVSGDSAGGVGTITFDNTADAYITIPLTGCAAGKTCLSIKYDANYDDVFTADGKSEVYANTSSAQGIIAASNGGNFRTGGKAIDGNSYQTITGIDSYMQAAGVTELSEIKSITLTLKTDGTGVKTIKIMGMTFHEPGVTPTFVTDPKMPSIVASETGDIAVNGTKEITCTVSDWNTKFADTVVAKVQGFAGMGLAVKVGDTTVSQTTFTGSEEITIDADLSDYSNVSEVTFVLSGNGTAHINEVVLTPKPAVSEYTTSEYHRTFFSTYEEIHEGTYQMHMVRNNGAEYVKVDAKVTNYLDSYDILAVDVSLAAVDGKGGKSLIGLIVGGKTLLNHWNAEHFLDKGEHQLTYYQINQDNANWDKQTITLYINPSSLAADGYTYEADIKIGMFFLKSSDLIANGVSFDQESYTVAYDGTAKTVEANAPQDAQVTYTYWDVNGQKCDAPTELGAYTVVASIPNTRTHLAAQDSATLIIKEKAAAPENVQATAEWKTIKFSAPDGIDSIEYKLGEDGEWAGLNTLTDLTLTDGLAYDTEYSIFIRTKATEDKLASDEVTLTVKTAPQPIGTIEEITNIAEVSGDTISVSGSTLEWYPANNAGRYQDGWWVGFKIVAPESITATNVGKVKYSNDGTDDLVKDFGTLNDGTTTDGKYYIGCWLPIMPEYLEMFLAAGSNMQWKYKFDWTGDGTADQTFTAMVDPNNITLMKDGKVNCKTYNGFMTVKDGAERTSGSIEKITDVAVVDGDTISVSGSSLEWFAKDQSVGRYQDGWWIGFKIVAPASVMKANVNKVKYSNDGTDDLVKEFGKNNDGTTAEGKYYIGCWLPVMPEYLEMFLAAGSNMQWTYKFDWNGDGTADQTFTATVDPNNIILNKDGGVWCKTENGFMKVKDGEDLATKGYIEKITDVAEVSVNTITVSGASLEWFAKDQSVGRYQDGWWIGFKIVAPASVIKANVSKVTYSNDGTDTLAKNFGTNNDGTTGEGKYYMGCWLPVMPEYLETALANGSILQWTYKFDWDGDNNVDQTFTATVDPNNITLNKDGGVWCKTENGLLTVKDGEEVHYHAYGTEWKSDDTNHWHECSCGEKSELAAHTYGEWTITKDATEKLNGEKSRTCTVCGKTETAQTPILPHSFGTEWKCDGTSHWHECACGEKADLTDHTYSIWMVTKEATETAKGEETRTCSVCGNVQTRETPVLSHSFGTEWKSDDTNHWHECACGEKSELAAHTYGEWTVTKEATETAKGEKTRSCTVCGKTETEEIPVAPHTHAYGTEWKSDGTNHWHECACGEKSEVAAHTYGEWTVTKEATETAKGEKTHTCTVCGKTETEEIPELPQKKGCSGSIGAANVLALLPVGVLVMWLCKKKKKG